MYEMKYSSRHKWFLMVLLAASWPAIGSALVFLAGKMVGTAPGKTPAMLIALFISGLGAFILFPFAYKVPTREASLGLYLSRLGLKLDRKLPIQAAFGVLFASLTLGSMLLASIATGRYVFDPSNVSLDKILRALNAGVFEEFFYRGVVMTILFAVLKSRRKAFILQVGLFALAHVKSLSPEALFDVVSVSAIAACLTLIASISKGLWAGIVFHTLHDAFLLLVQPPKGEYLGFGENATFYSLLFLALAVISCIALAARKALGGEVV